MEASIKGSPIQPGTWNNWEKDLFIVLVLGSEREKKFDEEKEVMFDIVQRLIARAETRPATKSDGEDSESRPSKGVGGFIDYLLKQNLSKEQVGLIS